MFLLKNALSTLEVNMESFSCLSILLGNASNDSLHSLIIPSGHILPQLLTNLVSDVTAVQLVFSFCVDMECIQGALFQPNPKDKR